jgi:CBS domain containing-hemolysin-like protein
VSEHGDIDAEEAQIVAGALTFSGRKVGDVMTPRTVMHTIEDTTIVDDSLRHMLAEEGFMRVPIYQGTPDTIIGVVHLSQLMKSGVTGEPIGNIASKGATFVKETDPLDKTFVLFLKAHRHLFIVKDNFGGVSGVVSLEDVLEEIIQTQIHDETDVHTDLREHAAKRA